MKIELHQIKIKDLVNGYIDSDEEGVKGYGGLLDIRPKYQREFVYKDEQRNAVIKTVRRGFPLNTFYWVKNNDCSFEVLDGQQRTISICSYINGDYSIDEKYFHTLSKDEQEQILNYELMVYFCEGKDSEKLEWFKTINIAGVQLSDQELRNAVYTGPWLTLAKRDFSKRGCRGVSVGDKYIKGEILRQELLETVLKWISHGKIEQYMADHQYDESANELWMYFDNVISWVKTIFPKYRTPMKGLPWGDYYNKYKESSLSLNPDDTEKRIAALMEDYDVSNKKGIYLYILSGEERNLSIRAFDERTKRSVYERQKGVCPICKKHFEIGDMEADHIIPWCRGGKTELNNCQMLCRKCNREKSAK